MPFSDPLFQMAPKPMRRTLGKRSSPAPTKGGEPKEGSASSGGAEKKAKLASAALQASENLKLLMGGSGIFAPEHEDGEAQPAENADAPTVEAQPATKSKAKAKAKPQSFALDAMPEDTLKQPRNCQYCQRNCPPDAYTTVLKSGLCRCTDCTTEQYSRG